MKPPFPPNNSAFHPTTVSDEIQPPSKPKTKKLKQKRKIKHRQLTNPTQPEYGNDDADAAAAANNPPSPRVRVPPSRPTSKQYIALQQKLDRLESETIDARLNEAAAQSSLITLSETSQASTIKLTSATRKLSSKISKQQVTPPLPPHNNTCTHTHTHARTHARTQVENDKLLDLLRVVEEDKQSYIKDHDSQRDFMINVFHVQRSRHQQELDAMRQLCVHELDTSKLRLQETQLLEVEALNEEVIHLRTTIVELDVAINEINELHLEQVAENLKHNNFSLKSPNNASSPTKKFQSLSKATIAMNRINARLAEKNEKIAMEAIAKKGIEKKKNRPLKGFIGSWLSDAKSAFTSNNGEITQEEAKAIQSAITDDVDSKKSEVEKAQHQLAVIEKLQQQKSKIANEKFLAAAKSLKSGPGRMTVAVAKLEHQLEHMYNKLELAEDRELKTREMLEACEMTMMNMVRDQEAEAVLLSSMEGSGSGSGFGFGSGSGSENDHDEHSAIFLQRNPTHKSDKEHIVELERQKKVLCDLLNEYEENSAHNIKQSQSNLKLNLVMSPDDEFGFRSTLIEVLGLGGTVSDDDITYEVEELVGNRDRYLSLDPPDLVELSLHNDSPQSVELQELLSAKVSGRRWRARALKLVRHN